MPEIDSLPDWICNVVEAMKQYFFTKSEISNNYSEKTHTHPIDNELKNNSENPVQNKIIKSALDGKSNINHNHNISDVNSLQSELDDKADVVHTHDNYVTSDELNTGLAGKANTNHNHSNVTTNANGFMSSTDKSKLDGIATGANKTIVDAALSSTSTNPVQNKAINTALNTKADKTTASSTNNGLMSYTDKNKLDNIHDGARAKKRTLGFYIYSDIDNSNQALIIIKRNTRLKVRLYSNEDSDNWNNASFPPQLSLSYVINGVVSTIQTNNDPASLNVGLNPGEYQMHFAFGGTGNFYPCYRSILLKVIS